MTTNITSKQSAGSELDVNARIALTTAALTTAAITRLNPISRDKSSPQN